MRMRLRPAEGLLTLVGLGLILWAVLDSVITANWVEHLGVLGWIATIAFCYGLFVAKTRLPAIPSHLAAVLVGGAVVLFFVSRTMPMGYTTTDRLLHLWQRFFAWFEITVSGGIGTDNMLFLLFLGFLGWFIVYFSMWSVFRERGVWLPLVSTGTGLIINLSYARDLAWYLVPYLIGAFALVVRLHIFKQEESWRRARVDYETEFGWDYLSTGLLASAVIIGLVWFAPRAYAAEQIANNLSHVSQPWRDVENEFGRLFGGLAARYEGGPGRPLGISGFSRVMALRSSTSLSPTEIMYIESPRRSYWRAVVYERYTGTGWMMGEATNYELAKGDPRLGSGYEARLHAPITYTVVILDPRGEVVVAAPEPRRFNIPVKAELSRTPAGFQAWTGEGETPSSADETLEVGMVRSPVVTRRGSYSAVSMVSVADEASLRQASTDYPAWVKDRYLQLPRLPKEVGDLAHQVTNNATNPYDKAKALEAHLRTGYTYSENINPATSGQDAVGHFLFTGKAGYCDYFSSAMAVMLRTLGIPARVAAGYASGTLDEGTAVWVVRDSDSHAWVEAYFPGYGWIDFEPTPIRPVAARQEADPTLGGISGDYWDDELWDEDYYGGPLLPFPERETRGLRLNVPRAAAITGAVVLTLVLIAAAMLTVIWQRGLRGLSVSEAVYARMGRLAGWMGVRQAAHQTPSEYAGTLGGMVPEVSGDTTEIADAYVRVRFGRKTTTTSEETPLLATWQRVRNGLVAAFVRGPGLGRDRSR